MKKLYFIRHGESEANVAKLFAGRWETPLTKLGRGQAKAAAQKAKSLDIDCIVSSPLLRARQTAEIIAGEIGLAKDNIVFSDLFMERDYGDLQAKPYENARNIDFEKVPNIESTSSVIDRAKKAALFLKEHHADNILVVGHGTHGLTLQKEILKSAIGEIEVTIDNEIPNAEIVEWI